MDKKALQEKLPAEVEVLRFREHSKASEKYVDLKLTKNHYSAEVSLPYYYRRSGLFIENEKELSILILGALKQFNTKEVEAWVKQEKGKWEREHRGKQVTKPFFERLLSLDWACVDCKLPKNRNWARRIQDIKEMGYLLATDTKRYCPTCKRNTTQILLLPINPGEETGYEIWTPSLRAKIINGLGNINIYENKKVNSNYSLIPDHKFPEIRWDNGTKEKNPDDMSDSEIKEKFQLLDNQRNLQKREVCRNCFQSGIRGSIYGIDYFYKGNQEWDKTIPTVGKGAEEGCKGCPWYDIGAWRKSLNKKLNS